MFAKRIAQKFIWLPGDDNVFKKSLRVWLAALCLVMLAAPALAQIAPDPSGIGPYRVDSAEYKLPPKRDVLVAPFTVTELWARIYRPTDATGARPVVVMLHGNHSTCGRFDPAFPGRIDDDSTYTETGTCPEGYVVVPNHEGYAYLANQLASWGYYVVSINANRGVNAAWGDDEDFGLNLRRGRLILRHLIQLDRWNTSNSSAKVLGFNLRGQLDFNQIGLFGHSRGGEGIRAALNQYRDVGSIWPSQFRNKPAFRALFELAPVDGQTNRVLNADGAAWNVLLPTCDGDVSDLQGKNVFDRMIAARAETQPAPKSMFTVEGANHNFYNTEWQQSDSQFCFSTDPAQPVVFDPAATGSVEQQTTALYPVTAFFRAHLGLDPVSIFGQLFDPAFGLPTKLAEITPFRRTFTDTVARKGSIVLDDFVRPIGRGETASGNQSGGLSFFAQTNIPEHEPTAQFGVLAWDTTVRKRGGEAPFYQANAAAPGSGVALRTFEKLEFRIGLACKGFAEGNFFGCEVDRGLNPTGTTDFSIALVSVDGFVTKPVRLGRYAKPLAPVGLGFGPIIIDDPRPANTGAAAQTSNIDKSDPPLFPEGSGHPILQTVRIPLGDFDLPKGARVRGMRITFNRAAKGAIYLGNIRFTRQPEVPSKDDLIPVPLIGDAAPVAVASGTLASGAGASGAEAAASAPAANAPIANAPTARAMLGRTIAGGKVTRILQEKRPIMTATQVIRTAKLAAAPRWPVKRDVISIAISLPEPLVIGGSLLTLRIGGQSFLLGQAVPLAAKGFRAARFYLPPAAFAALADGTPMMLENGTQRFDLGPLDKSLLR